MLIDRAGRLRVARMDIRSPEYTRDMPPAVGGIAGCRFIEIHDQNAVPAWFECRIGGQGVDDIRLQPCVRLLRSSIVGIVVNIWNNEGILR